MIDILIVFVLGLWAVLVGTYFGLELVDKGLSIYLKHLKTWNELRGQNDFERV
jgi:hypothetical protein